MFKHYISLAKPGIIFGNLIAAVAGFLLASKGNFNPELFVATMMGVILIIASGCALNNVIDRDIDGIMQRTRNRVLVTGVMPISHALIFAVLAALAGFSILYSLTSLPAFFAGVAGFAVYVGLYSLMFKRRTVHATAIGSLSGACPPVIGYLSVTGEFDIGAGILLVAFCIWQMPHSYAIAIYRLHDYADAGIPVLPVRKGIKTAQKHMLVYILAFIGMCVLLTYQNYTGMIFAISMILLGLYWAYITMANYNLQHPHLWGRKMFIFSVITICCFSLLISLDFVAADPLVIACH